MSSLSDDPSLSRKVYKKFYKNSMLAQSRSNSLIPNCQPKGSHH